MRILICGVGAIGSNLAARLASDLKDHDLTILDNDKVEERNIQAGTQLYSPDQVGISKVDALEYTLYKWYQKTVVVDEHKIVRGDEFLNYDLIIDCLDNQEGRAILHKQKLPTLHVGFSDNYTFAIEWNENYKVPTNIEGLDICEMQGASAFVNSVASLAALVAESFILEGKKLEIVGGKFTHNLIK